MKAGGAAIAGKKSSALEELTGLPVRGENPYIREWKEKGGKVFGYVCSYVPEEVLFADPVTILPVRMGAVGCDATGEADVCLPKFMCGFAKCLLQLGLTGEYRFLDGMVMTNGCDQLRRTYEYWRDEVKLPFLTMVAVPHCMDGEERAGWYHDEVVKLIDDVGTRYGYIPSEDSLRKSIRTVWTWGFTPHMLYLPDWLEEEFGMTYLECGISNLPQEVVGYVSTASVESMIEGLAWRAFNFPMGRTSMGYFDVYVNDLVKVAKTYKADAAVFSGHMACKHSWAAAKMLGDALLEDAGIPSFKWETDFLDKRFTPHSVAKTQLSEFFRTLM